MTAPVTDAPADGGGVEGQAPESSTNPAGPGDTSTGTGEQGDGPRGRRTERVRSSSRDDDEPQEGHDGDGDADRRGKGDKGGDGKGDWRIEDLPPGAQKLIADLRKENGSRRSEAGEAKKRAEAAEGKAKAGDERFAAATEAFMRAIGLTPEPDEAERSPEERLADLTGKFEQSQQQARQARVELAVYQAAADNEGDPRALLDSVGFLNKVKDLDPAGDDFEQAIADAISDAVADNPKLRAVAAYAPPPAPSGGDFGGGPAGPPGPEEWSVDDFRRNRNGRGNP